jgi:hypothetical protein
MIWFYVKDDARLRYEIRRDAGDQQFELVAVYPDGRCHTERFDEGRGLIERSLEFQRSLQREGWQPLGPDESAIWRL